MFTSNTMYICSNIHKDIHIYVSPPQLFTGQLRRAPIMYNGLYNFSDTTI